MRLATWGILTALFNIVMVSLMILKAAHHEMVSALGLYLIYALAMTGATILYLRRQ